MTRLNDEIGITADQKADLIVEAHLRTPDLDCVPAIWEALGDQICCVVSGEADRLGFDDG